MKTMITIQTPDPKTRPTIEADVQGVWAIHRGYDPDKTAKSPRDLLWTLTHVPSGTRVASYRSLVAAKAARKRAMSVPGTEGLRMERRRKAWYPVDPAGCLPALAAALR